MSNGIALIGVFDDAGQVLLTRSVARPDVWQGIGGHVEEAETPKKAAMREAEEEVHFILNAADLTQVLVCPSDTQPDENIHFFSAKLKTAFSLKYVQREEILEARAFSLNTALELPMLPAMHAFLQTVAA